MGTPKATSSLFNCPAYLIRNPYSYCFRMNVPRDLKDSRCEATHAAPAQLMGKSLYG